VLYPAELPGLDQTAMLPARSLWTRAPGAGKAPSMDLSLAHRLRKQIVRTGAGLALRLGVGCLALGICARVHADCGAPSGSARVVSVDERLDIAIDDGRIVRLAGLEAPDPSRGSPKISEAARKFLADRLVGREVELRLLASGTDRWGRVLADLSVQNISDGQANSVATALLSAGYARVRPEFESRNCALARLAVEDGARRAGLGMWSEPEYSVIPASDPVALHSRDGQFVIVEGRVRRVGVGRSRLYLDLASRGGPTIVIARRLEQALAQAGRPVEALEGKTIRARGALDNRIGPRIEVSEPAMIEIVRRADAQGAEKLRQ
jgi:endonuclease YncB( thermonuclease family)